MNIYPLSEKKCVMKLCFRSNRQSIHLQNNYFLNFVDDI